MCSLGVHNSSNIAQRTPPKIPRPLQRLDMLGALPGISHSNMAGMATQHCVMYIIAEVLRVRELLDTLGPAKAVLQPKCPKGIGPKCPSLVGCGGEGVA